MALEPIEILWENLLSRQPELIRKAYASLDEDSQKAVLAHMTRMATEEGWHPQQQASALAAIDLLIPFRRKRH